MDKPKSKRGGPRPGSGRPRGKPDRATIEQKATLEELARSYTDAALATLHRVCTTSESDSAATTAAVALLDRGYGKPRQAVEVGGDPNNPLSVVTRVERHIIDPEDRADTENPDPAGVPAAVEPEEV